MSTAEKLLTADEFAVLPDNGQPCELISGRIVWMNPPKPRHGEVCGNAFSALREFIKAGGLGRILCNDSGVVTRRNPDTVRGADIAYYSFQRIPPGPLPDVYLSVPPDLVVEVRSPDDRWKDLVSKAAEYLDAGVAVVCVLDPAPQTVHLFRADLGVEVLNEDQDLTLPDILPGFRVSVRKLFE